MSWKLLAALGAGAGATVWALRRRGRREALATAGWSAATDAVVPTQPAALGPDATRP